VTFPGMNTMTPDNKFRERIKKLHAKLGSSNPNEADAARCKLLELLREKRKTWNDLPEILSGGRVDAGSNDVPDNDSDDGPPPNIPGPLDLVCHMLQRYLHLALHQRIAVALWIFHTHVFDRFIITPRIALRSPVSGCGKSTALLVIEQLAAKSTRVDNTTAAAVYRLVDFERPTLILDEGDNLNLQNNPTLRAVVNSGHRAGGCIMRVDNDGTTRAFSTFAPMALAVIGKLPLTTTNRSIVIDMEPPPREVELMRFNEHDLVQKADLETVYDATFQWARQCKLGQDPPMPKELHNRRADNWRILLSIADACGPRWANAAREAAIALSAADQDEDPGVTLLSNIRDIFDCRSPVDRLTSAVIIEDLKELPSGMWEELSKTALARRLTPFGIRTQTIWPRRRGTGDNSAKGYLRNEFERAWAAYCDQRPSPRHNVRYLRDA
jgi:hypothetical protein